MTSKYCNLCKEEKTIENFCKNNARKNGYSSNCKQCRKEISKKYKEKNREIINEKNKIYLREYRKNRIVSDKLFKLSTTIRTTIKSSFKRGNYTKKSKTYNILGCSFLEFKLYIESKFEDWMTWNNHGMYTGNYNETWQYDHIIPISSAKTEEELIKLNHYTNLQPLCSRVNKEKYNSI